MRKLSQKNLFYSILLAAVMMLFLVGYFIFMLPSLYVDYVSEQNLEAVKKQHAAFIKQGSYEGVKVRNPTACVSIKIPLQDAYIELTSKLVSIKMIPETMEMEQLLQEVQKFIDDTMKQEDFQNESFQKLLKTKLTQWQATLNRLLSNHTQLPLRFEVIHSEQSEDAYHSEYYKLHYVSKQMVVMESSVEDDSNRYTNYLAVETVSDGIVFSILPVITPEMEEIKPIVIQSLPMLGAVILILVLIFSQIYSDGIVRPILMLVWHTESMKTDHNFVTQPLDGKWQKRKDEIGQLAVTIDELYQQVTYSYQALLEENERQEVFLRASSHQLKTPVTAALLLLDGMIGQIGKYKDTRTYLPKVKEQLLSMRKIIEEILSLKAKQNSACKGKVFLYTLIQTQLDIYRVAVADRRLMVTLEGNMEAYIIVNRDIITKILDNLISNAVNYTPKGEAIHIFADHEHILIRNQGVTIPTEILQHIFEPFVSGNHEIASHGLGLYIAKYYADVIGAKLTIQNHDYCVETILYYK